jgi:vitamin B12 transporter
MPLSITPQSNVVSFRRWTRKPWAVFNSLGRCIRIGVLGLAFSILVLPGHAQVHSDSSNKAIPADKEVDLDEVVVSAQRGPVLHSELMRVVGIISRTEIEQSASPDIPGLLEHAAGIDIRQRGVFGMQADISIRGGTFDQTLILLNGVNLTDPQTGHHNFNLPVDINSIEKIEILRGPGARIFGPNAFNGAINIITRQGNKKEFTGSVSGGQYKLGNASLAYSLPLGRMSNHIALSGITSAGYTENTDFRNGNAYYRFLLPVSASVLDFQTGYTIRAFGANAFYSPKYPNQFELTRSEFASVSVIPEGKLKLKGQLYWRRHHDRFELFRENPPQWYSTHNYHMTDAAGGSLNWSITTAHTRSNAGIEYRYEHIFSNVLGDTLETDKPVPGEPGMLFNRAYERSGINLMAEHSAQYGKFSFSAGLLLHVNAAISRGSSLYPGIDLGYKLHENTTWFISGNKTLRLPTFTDMFYNSPTNAGNKELKPEEAYTLETGVKYSKGSISLETSVFKRWGRNMIDWVKYPADLKWISMNLTSVNITGVEAGATYSFDTEVNRFLKTATINYTYLYTDKVSDGFSSLYVLDNLKHKLAFSLSHSITQQSGLKWKMSVQDRNGGYQPFGDGSYLPEVAYKPVTLIDLNAWYNYRFIQFFAEASNLLNTKVMDHANVLQPGIWAKGGVKVTL